MRECSYRLAAEQGNADAQKNLGAMYKHGQGATQDYKEAVKWYRMAAEQGNVYAQDNLGDMYYLGQGV
ncbi:MAG: sel1 repeat family protein, partial [Gammaproteobacteria bacterium]|nr:sel1 repeat family protein [Gammaproteobacteria bacterium]